MRKLIFILLTIATFQLTAQIEEPVTWEFETKYIGNGEFDLISTAIVDKGWYIYSQDLSDDGPVPTTFTFKPGSRYQLVGRTNEDGKFIEGFDAIFDMNVKKFKEKATFTQRVKLLKPYTSIKGELEFMTCDDEKCLPPETVEFKFKAKIPKDEPSQSATTNNSSSSAVTATANDATSSTETVANTEELENADFGINIGGTDDEAAQSGILDPVKWTMRQVQDKDDPTIFQLIWEAKIDDGWYVYSRDIEEGGPVPTTFDFDENEDVEFLQKDLKEIGSNVKEGQDKIFDMYLKKYSKDLTYITRVKAKKPNAELSGSFEFMTCDHSRCLPPEFNEFVFDFSQGDKEIYIGEAGGDETSASLKYKIPTVDLKDPLNDCGEEKVDTSEKGIFSIFFLGFLGGLVALLTPCVFPMIPLTVSFFTKSNKSRAKGIFNAILYGAFIFIIYLLLSVPFHLMDSIDPEILNKISTSVPLNVAFFIIFVVFAISFFGYFEITLPSSLANKADSASNIGGLIGIFFMALTLALVSFSCTGPILGSLLAGALTSDGGAWQLSAGMGGFGLALGIPFALFALFPRMLDNLPRSGGWLNTVKVVLGFVELALAIKFLSNADLVKEWGILKREVFFALWIIIGIGLTLYLFGLIHFPHDSKGQKIGFPRIATGVLVLAFVVYLIPGLSSNDKYANRALLSGFPPPLFYSVYEKASNCPLDLPCYKDYEEGLAYAKSVNKPILVDFTGWACVNCRKMEENVWVKPEIFEKLNEEFVLISLYVDDKKDLPEEEKETITLNSTKKQKKIRIKGDKWSTLQTETFNNNSQPYYAIISPDELLLNNPVGYKPDVSDYNSFLECGLNAFSQLEQMQPAERSKMLEDIKAKNI